MDASVAERTPPRRRDLVVSNTSAVAALAGASSFAFFTTWLFLSPAVNRVDRTVLIAMIAANVVVATILLVQVGLRLFQVWSAKRSDLAGARTHLRLVGVFSIVAAVPAVLAFLFAFTILRTSLDDIFSNRIDGYVDIGRNLANTYFNEAGARANLNLRQIEGDIRADARELLVTPALAPIIFRLRLKEQVARRGLDALYIMDGDRRVVASVSRVSTPLNMPPALAFDEIDREAAAGRPIDQIGRFGVNDAEKLDFFRGMIKVPEFNGGYIISYKRIPDASSGSLLEVRGMRDDWDKTKQGRDRIERVFFASYILLAIIILAGAIWLALWAANGIVKPIGRLVGMAERVSGGDLGARVAADKADGEFGVLANSMNHMTAQLQTQRNDLIETNRRFDARRRFTEAVLSGVSAGVMGVARDGMVTIANRSAAELLESDVDRLIGADVARVLPEFGALLDQAAAATPGTHDASVADEIDIERDGRLRTLSVRIARDDIEADTGREAGFVVTFDDITQLVSAQRSAAWGDVARRIAHEIKNPLTPIQLSAERLQRKYRGEITTTPDVFDRCVDTIVRHVSDIGRMVDEFSSFARMPKPVFGIEDLEGLAKTAVFPQRVAFPDIAFTTDAPTERLEVACDGRLIVQALSNLLKNAGESVAARLADAPAGVDTDGGRIRLALEKQGEHALIHVVDNGVGLPAAQRHRLTEPYMTTREKGTGLGLAIVKKVIEEHGGAIAFSDDATLGDTGARVTLRLPLSEAAQAEQGPSADASACDTANEHKEKTAAAAK
ncbi:MAG: PAS domain-containing sensor histidine kinase [Pseudomonadota bacterium]